MKSCLAIALVVLAACGGGEAASPHTTPIVPAAPNFASGAAEGGDGAPAAGTGGFFEDSPEPVKLVLWHAYRGEERKALDELVGTFNDRHQNLSIRALPVPFDALVDKLNVTIPRGKGPDIFIFAHNLIGEWLEADATPLIEPLNGTWAKRGHVFPFLPEAIRPLVRKKSLWGLPLAYKSLVLYYNKALVKTPPANTDELIALAKRQTSAAEKRFGLVYEADKLYHHALWVHGFGGTVLDADDAPQLATPQQIAALTFARSLVREHGIVPEGMTTYMVTSLFNDGAAAMAFNGPWFRGDIGEGVDYGVALLPAVSATGQPAQPFLGIEAVFMNARSEKKRWAYQAMRFLTSDEAAMVRCLKGKQPVPNRAVYEDERVRADPFIPVFAAQAKQAVPMPASQQMQVVWATVDTALAGAIFGETAPAAALADAQKKATFDISRQQK